jgi:hypothetical protein
MRFVMTLIFLVGMVPIAVGAPAVTVLNAVKLLPRDKAKNIVRIEAREGTPAPERWYIVVYDETEESGLHEYVVFGKELVASRSLSQFLDGAKPDDVVGGKLLKVDSDDLMKTVQLYVEANKLAVNKVNYTMKKDAPELAPFWRMTCIDDADKKIAELVVNARNGNVIAHDGFALTPSAVAKASPSPSASPGTAAKPSATVRPPAGKKNSPAPVSQPKPSPPRGGLFQRMFH